MNSDYDYTVAEYLQSIDLRLAILTNQTVAEFNFSTLGPIYLHMPHLYDGNTIDITQFQPKDSQGLYFKQSSITFPIVNQYTLEYFTKLDVEQKGYTLFVLEYPNQTYQIGFEYINYYLNNKQVQSEYAYTYSDMNIASLNQNGGVYQFFENNFQVIEEDYRLLQLNNFKEDEIIYTLGGVTVWDSAMMLSQYEGTFLGEYKVGVYQNQVSIVNTDIFTGLSDIGGMMSIAGIITIFIVCIHSRQKSRSLRNTFNQDCKQQKSKYQCKEYFRSLFCLKKEEKEADEEINKLFSLEQYHKNHIRLEKLLQKPDIQRIMEQEIQENENDYLINT